MLRRFLPLAFCFAALISSALAQAPATPTPAATPAPPPPNLQWHDVTKWGVEGRAWPDDPRQRWFQRLPDSAKGKVTDPVWSLSQDSTGMAVRFKTDATTIWTHYVLRTDRLAMPHMPATGASGVDLYARDEKGRWRWVNCTKPDKKEMKVALINGMAPGTREYLAYLPLFNGPDTIEIGVPEGATFEELAPRSTPPIVFYGTSITHGACASRPGMVHTAILGRHLDWPVINLGFSGNGKMDATGR